MYPRLVWGFSLLLDRKLCPAGRAVLSTANWIARQRRLIYARPATETNSETLQNVSQTIGATTKRGTADTQDHMIYMCV